MAHSSLRFGIGRFTTEAEIDYVVEKIIATVQKLRDMRYVILHLHHTQARIFFEYPLTPYLAVLYGKWSKRVSTSTQLTGLNTRLDSTFLFYVTTPFLASTSDTISTSYVSHIITPRHFTPYFYPLIYSILPCPQTSTWTCSPPPVILVSVLVGSSSSSLFLKTSITIIHPGFLFSSKPHPTRSSSSPSAQSTLPQCNSPTS